MLYTKLKIVKIFQKMH